MQSFYIVKLHLIINSADQSIQRNVTSIHTVHNIAYNKAYSLIALTCSEMLIF